ncbi:MAG: TonB family protein [Acidobacteria bacterium]|nr:TonB family protein [Acidobacteriota bacterium]MCW5948181.1 TonB family protein [Pyrinomonadaceae bacterium]
MVLRVILAAFGVLLSGLAAAASPKLAILAPTGSPHSLSAADRISSLANDFDLVDRDLAAAAFRSFDEKAPFNMTAERARSIGEAIGCDILILVDSESVRRSSSSRESYYEAYASIFTVGIRDGLLLNWTKLSGLGDLPDEAEASLSRQIGSETPSILKKALSVINFPIEPVLDIAEFSAENSAAQKGLRPPAPYRRIKPKYTDAAFLNGIEATVEATVDIDAEGRILRLVITRWAGYGLDSAVEQAVREMNWMPASRGGKALPMRVLLRYNFKKPDKSQQ